MNYENFLPINNWNGNLNELLKDPKVITGLGVAGIVALPAVAALPFISPFIYYPIWLWLTKYFIDKQTQKKIAAIRETFKGKYDEDYLRDLSVNNREEFNRLFKLASDEFFRRYIEEQAEHVKAQKIIVELQMKINEMQQRLEFLMKKKNKHEKDINELRNEISIYEEILGSWKNKSENYDG